MRAVWGIFAGVFLGIVLIVVLAALLAIFGPFRFDGETAAATTMPDTPAAQITPSSPAITQPTPVASPAVITPSKPAPAATTPLSPLTSLPPALSPLATSSIPETKKEVNFQWEMISITGSGYSRHISSRLTNTGSADAHNTVIKIEAYYQGSKVKIGGKEYILHNLGTISAGTTQQIETDIRFSITDGTKIRKNGVDFTVSLSSDEKNLSVSYHYSP